MKKHYFLGNAITFSPKERLRQLFTIGTAKDSEKLRQFLAQKYHSTIDRTILTKNGRSALALAIQNLVPQKSGIIINGFTCYAVVEAVKAAHCTPIFADIDKKTLNFTPESIIKAIQKSPQPISAIIIQNTLGNPADIVKIKKIADKYNLKIIEDLAHCTSLKYDNNQEAGTIGEATVLSFGKDKSIDTISGGAVILQNHPANIKAPTKPPKFSDNFRARLYPTFSAIYRALTHCKLNGPWMRFLLATHLVERSADNKLDLSRRAAHFEAKIALIQLKKLTKHANQPLRQFVLVKNRDQVLKNLQLSGYYFNNFWYETPIAPSRYYAKVNFPEHDCPVATEVAKTIINIPTYYTKSELQAALKIINEAKYE